VAENKAELIVDGDVSPLRQKLREAGRDLKQFGDEGKSSMERVAGPLATLQSKFIAIGALLAGGAVFKQAVTEAAAFTEESLKLGNALGISATEASTFIAARAAIDVSPQAFVTSSKGRRKDLKNNADGLQAMGLQTRDAAGNLRPLNELMVDAVDVLNGYKAGTDRALAGQALFGKGLDINGNLIKLNSETLKENAELQKSLGLIVGQDNVEAWQAYDQAMDQSSLTMKAMRTTIGNALIPVLTKLGEWFVSIGPVAITVIKGAIGGLIGAFWALKNGVTVVWEVINAMVVTVAEPLRALAAAIVKIGTGDFSGAWGEFQKAGETMTAAWKGALQEILVSSEETKRKIWELFAQGGPAVAPGTGGKSASGLVKEGSKDKKDKPFDEEGFRQDLMQGANAQADKELADLRRAAEKEIEIRRKAAQQVLQIKLLQVEGARNAEMARLDELAAQSQYEVDIGSSTQAEHLARLAQFNQQRLSAEQAFQAQKKELALQDPEQNPVELERIEQEKAEIRRRYAAQGMDIQRQQSLESQGIWQSLTSSIEGLWDKGIQALMNGTLTWKGAFQAIGTELVGWFASKVVGDMVKEWLGGQVKKIAALLGFTATEKGIQTAGAATTVGIKGAETTAVAGMNAVQAGTGAAASQASIPYIGPILALAAMATIFAAVSAMGKKKSAMGGYDVPRGVNPMTQLHEEEMVLPKQYANAIRGMTKGGVGEGGESAPPQVNVNITSMDSRGVRDVLLDNPDALAEAIRKAHRNGFR